MRGIPSSLLILFFAVVFLVELISYFGFRILISSLSKKIQSSLLVIYLLLSISVTGLIVYSFSNPEVIRQSRDYTLFFVVISLSFLNLMPKTFFALITLISFLIRWLSGIRGQRIALAGAAILSTGFFLLINYGIWAGRYDIRVEKQNLYFTDLPKQLDGFKIVQLSDIHLGSFGKNTSAMKETVAIIEQLQPDILLFTGDIVNNFGEEFNGFEPLLKQLSARYGKFAIQGNHDYGDYFNWPDSTSKRINLEHIEAGLTNAGFKLLLNQWAKIAVKDTSFSLIGVENWGHPPFPQYADMNLATKGIPENSFKILMSHDPEYWNAFVVPQTDIPLTLSGHTHGGQFGVKIAGIEFSPMYFIQKKWGGLYQSGDQLLYVNRGLGTVGFPGRIEMRPEITLLTLFRTKNH
ncbi:MAG TPA: metallophosphoesterase [Prolixibacteraceae bacterium]|nr:metallophosphoesterase [Prolixibacteraceae bacterium]